MDPINVIGQKIYEISELLGTFWNILPIIGTLITILLGYDAFKRRKNFINFIFSICLTSLVIYLWYISFGYLIIMYCGVIVISFCLFMILKTNLSPFIKIICVLLGAALIVWGFGFKFALWFDPTFGGHGGAI
ncbi:MAG: hypothetical protein ACTSRZ_19135 [Promethearchaeota archaeon]